MIYTNYLVIAIFVIKGKKITFSPLNKVKVINLITISSVCLMENITYISLCVPKSKWMPVRYIFSRLSPRKSDNPFSVWLFVLFNKL